MLEQHLFKGFVVVDQNNRSVRGIERTRTGDDSEACHNGSQHTRHHDYKVRCNNKVWVFKNTVRMAATKAVRASIDDKQDDKCMSR